MLEQSRPDSGDAQGARGASSRGRKYTAKEKLGFLEEFKWSDESLRAFAARTGPTPNTLIKWRRQYEQHGLAGLEPKPNPRNQQGATRRRYTPEERREAIEAYGKSERTVSSFCALWGLAEPTFRSWLRAYRSDGPKGLEPARPGPKAPPDSLPRIAEPVKDAVVETKTRHPDFGLRRVRDFLLRFHGLRVSAGGVRRILRAAGIDAPPPTRTKPRRKPPSPRRFERARPGQMWQSDITSYVLTRHSVRVYLTVFLDDHSRYVVSWALHLHQKADLVIEALLDGIARYGKPQEVLTDQGRQYYAWRGKSAFQKLLIREGIDHVVSRAHHPQTLGKCERLWQTVGREFWERVRPQDLDDARTRLSHFFAHYNHFRPHQGIDGLVPADRFFSAEEAVRETIERELARNELDLALGKPLRRSVFLSGRVGDERVSLHGESGRLVFRTPDGRTQRLELADLGVEARKDDEDHGEETSDGADTDGAGNGRSDDGAERYVGELGEPGEAEAEAADGEEAGGLPAAGAIPGRGAGALAERGAGGAGAGARDVLDDAGVLAGADPEGGRGGAPGGAAAAGVAALADGDGGYAGGPPEAAADAAKGGADVERAERAPAAAEGEREARAREGAAGVLGRALALLPWPRRGRGARVGEGDALEEGRGEKKGDPSEEASPSDAGSGSGSGRRSSDGVNGPGRPRRSG